MLLNFAGRFSTQLLQFQGHVHARDIKRLLLEKSKGRDLSVPGMPIGSPGMEMGNNKVSFTAKFGSLASATQSRRSLPFLTRIDWSGFAHASSNEEN